MVISTSSSTCVESFAYGVPVIVVGSRNNVTQNPIPGSIPKCISELCYSVYEFNLAIEYYINRLDEENNKHKKIGLQIREGIFNFLNIEGDSIVAET